MTWVTRLGHDESSKDSESEAGWKHWVRDWYQEGIKRVDRIGKKYGVLGYEKQNAGEDGAAGPMQDLTARTTGAGAAEKVADAVAAYVLVKALLPVRIAVSIAGAPACARFVLLPLRKLSRQR